MVESVVVVALIVAIVVISWLALDQSKKQKKDTYRKSHISQISRFFSKECYLPEDGAGEYEVSEIIGKLKENNPGMARLIVSDLWDPAKGSAEQTYYFYRVSGDKNNCVLYTNLENSSEPVTLSNINRPTMGGGSGVFKSHEEGWNGTKRYYQISK